MRGLWYSRFFVLLLISFQASCLAPTSMKTHQEFVARLDSDYPDIATNYIESRELVLHYKSNGTPKSAIVIWIHGTPGSWEDGARLLVDESLTNSMLIVSVDRPGWGESHHLQGFESVEGFKRQGEHIAPLLVHFKEMYPTLPIILVGHSWGGSLTPWLANDYPEYVDGVVLAAAGMDPSLVKPRWYNVVSNTMLASWLLPKSLLKANDEVYALEPDLILLEKTFRNRDIPMIALQGMEDRLVHPENVDFIEMKFPAAHILRLPEQGHLLQFERSTLIAKCVLAMVEQKLTNCSE